MKRVLTILFFLFSYTSFSQSIGHFQQISTVKRGDTIDVAWYYRPASITDIRTFQVDFQFKRTLFTHIETYYDTTYLTNARQPQVGYTQFDYYRLDSFQTANSSYVYRIDSAWSVGRNYIMIPAGSSLGSNNGYIIHNKYKINDVQLDYESDSVTVNWARLFKVDGVSVGENVTLDFKKRALNLLGNRGISGKLWMPTNSDLGLPIIICYDNTTGEEKSRTIPALDGTYTLNNLESNRKYKIKVYFSPDSLNNIRQRHVTITDAVKSLNEVNGANVNQVFPRTFLKSGLSYLMADINFNSKLDAGDPYSIYASVSGLRPIDTSKLINVFHKNEYDSLALGLNQWTSWSTYLNRGVDIYDSVGNTSKTGVDIKFFILGDVNRSGSSPVFNSQGTLILANRYNGEMNLRIPDTYVNNSQPITIPFNVSSNAPNNGLQFEMRYDPTKVKFDGIESGAKTGWLQYVTCDANNGIIKFGGMNNQKEGFLNGDYTPYKLKFSPMVNGQDFVSYIYLRKLMDASNLDGDHFNVSYVSDRIQITNRANMISVVYNHEKPSININPNPNNGNFELVVMLPTNTKMNAVVYSMTGQRLIEIGEFRTEDMSMTFKKPMNLNLPNGIYNIVLYDDKKRLIKQFIKTI